jgi:hypothetical protein
MDKINDYFNQRNQSEGRSVTCDNSTDFTTNKTTLVVD